MKSESNFFKNSKILFLLLQFGTKDVSESLSKVLSDLVLTIMRFGITISLYYYLFQYKGGEIMGVDISVVAWSMFFYFMFMYINPRYISRDIQEDIKTGRIEVLLSKPVSYLHYKLGEYLGTRIFTFVFCTIVELFLVIYFFGIPPMLKTLLFATTFPFVLFLCLILSFQICSILGFLAFWIEDISPIRWVIDKMVMILGGAYFPVALFPETLRNISLYSPVGASQFISYTPYLSWGSTYLKMIAIQIIWIAIMGIVLHIVTKKSFKKLSINGG